MQAERDPPMKTAGELRDWLDAYPAETPLAFSISESGEVSIGVVFRPADLRWERVPLGEISDRDLAAGMNVSRATVGKVRRERGINSSAPHGGSRPRTKRKTPESLIDHWVALWDHGETLRMIHNRYSRFSSSFISIEIRKRLKLKRLPRR